MNIDDVIIYALYILAMLIVIVSVGAFAITVLVMVQYAGQMVAPMVAGLVSALSILAFARGLRALTNIDASLRYLRKREEWR